MVARAAVTVGVLHINHQGVGTARPFTFNIGWLGTARPHIKIGWLKKCTRVQSELLWANYIANIHVLCVDDTEKQGVGV